MRFLYFCNIAICAFALSCLGEVLRGFVLYPSLIYGSLAVTFIVLIAGIAPYRVRSRNPLALEFLVILFSLILGGILWF